MILGSRLAKLYEYSTYFFELQNILILIISISLFLIFLKFNFKYNKLINVISSSSFGIYLIHDNNFVRYFLWRNILRVSSFQHTPFLIVYSIVVVFLLFLICSIIDLIRQNTIEKLYMNFLNLKFNFFEKKLKYLYKKIRISIFGK